MTEKKMYKRENKDKDKKVDVTLRDFLGEKLLTLLLLKSNSDSQSDKDKYQEEIDLLIAIQDICNDRGRF